MTIGIYARKSVYSDESDSIETQINMCKDYAKNKYKDAGLVLEYSDEGFTGANTDRPGYKQLVDDIESKKIDVLVCYKIDRISRNVLDFSKTFEMLQENGVSFVSVKEQIDTSTPLGRAMMYICSVFAQMERETTAERVTDSMVELAKSGKWAGGRAPVGFKRKRVTIDGKKCTVLETDEEQLPYLNMIFDTFLEGYSLSRLETHFRKNNMRSINGGYVSATQVYNILKNPHYAQADKDTYKHFESLGCIMAVDRDKFDGKHGLMVYGRTSGGGKRTHKSNSPDKWIIAVGRHKPLMSSKKWLKAQGQFGQNEFNKVRKHKIGILKGLLKCKCGYTMGVHHKVDRKYNRVYNYYFCQRRNARGKEHCNMSMTPVKKLDHNVIEWLKELSLDKDIIIALAGQEKNKETRDKGTISREISTVKKKISNLTNALQENNGSTAIKYIVKEIEKLDGSLAGLNFELLEYEDTQRKKKENKMSADDIYSKVNNLLYNFNDLKHEDKSYRLRQIIKECSWDGENLSIII